MVMYDYVPAVGVGSVGQSVVRSPRQTRFEAVQYDRLDWGYDLTTAPVARITITTRDNDTSNPARPEISELSSS